MSHANCFRQFSAAAARTAVALAAVVTLGTLDAATRASAQGAWSQGAWCAHYYGRGGGGTNCGFYTIQQCREAVSGVGGECTVNPWTTPREQPQRRKPPPRGTQ